MAFAVISTDTSEDFIFEVYLTQKEAVSRYNEIAKIKPHIPLVCIDYHEPDSEEDGTVIAIQNMR